MAFKMNKPSMIKGTISHKTAINRSLDKPPASSAFQKVDPEDDGKIWGWPDKNLFPQIQVCYIMMTVLQF